jgi:hypothetical protein
MYPLSVPRGRVRCEHDPHIACKPYKQLDVSIIHWAYGFKRGSINE